MTFDLQKLTARDVMTRRPDTIRNDETIETAIEAMVNLGLSALPVVNRDGQCVGLLTKTDVIQLAGQLEQEQSCEQRNDVAALFFGVGLDEVAEAKVQDVMTAHVLSLTEDTPLTTIADKMLKHEIHHLPVCHAHGQVVGVVSSMDLVKALRDSVRHAM